MGMPQGEIRAVVTVLGQISGALKEIKSNITKESFVETPRGIVAKEGVLKGVEACIDIVVRSEEFWREALNAQRRD